MLYVLTVDLKSLLVVLFTIKMITIMVIIIISDDPKHFIFHVCLYCDFFPLCYTHPIHFSTFSTKNIVCYYNIPALVIM